MNTYTTFIFADRMISNTIESPDVIFQRSYIHGCKPKLIAKFKLKKK